MRKKASLFSNICIAIVIISLGAVIFTADLNHIFLTVSAPVFSGNRRNTNVSLMISVDGNGEIVRQMMEILYNHSVDATFFVTGDFALRNMAIVRDMADKFEIGNHAFRNIDIRHMRESDQRVHLLNTHELVRNVTATEDDPGLEMTLFSPPFGSFGRATLRVAQSMRYTTVMWSRDATDSQYRNPELVYQRATKGIENGDIVLLHPTMQTVEVLPRIIQSYLDAGLGIVRIGELIR